MNLICRIKAPFFYYGGKWKIAEHYPKPKFDKIIESFAGAAGYSSCYHSLDVTLYEINPKVFGVWDYLIKASADEIRKLPLDFESTDELSVCQEAKWLIGFWIAKATDQPLQEKISLVPSGTPAFEFVG
jgi:site-specific DNA-adenine methylase